MDGFRHRSAEHVLREFRCSGSELELNIAITYLEAHQPMPRNTVSIINRRGEVTLNYAKVFISNFGKDELLKPNPNVHDIGCDVNCSPGDRSTSARLLVPKVK